LDTKRLRLGTGVVVLPLNHPLRVAEDYAMLDLMSNGRVDLGVGRGYQPTEFAGYGIDQTQTREVFDEAITIIRLAWTAERVTFHGKHYRFDDVPVRPKPLQQPHPPIWMAALSPETFELAGRYGYHLLYGTAFGLPPEKAKALQMSYGRGLVAGGHDPARRRRAALVMVYVAATMEQAIADFRDPVVWYYRTISKYVAPPRGQAAVKSYEMYTKTRDLTATASWEDFLARKAVICGPPDYVVEELAKAQQTYGFTDLLCWTRLGGLDHRKVLRSMDLMGTKVFPQLRPLTPPELPESA
jgi:alkanesulfonate monooxygenase SsuD/methylene tetrahydromethanopterin reductase-like flavin-dependent oxidoreductase (luciferase family)